MAEFDTTDFDAIKISLASADQIRSWSHGEVKKPETINYRTLKPEKDGLFCEKIFGPVKDWECACGKYKGIRFKGIICERCGVEVTTAKVRRERMGHIELAAPVSHIWYFKSPASFPMSRLLDMKSKDLEKVLYFASYVITDVDTEAREADADDLKEELAADLEELDAERDDQIERLKEQGQATGDEFDDVEPLSEEEVRAGIADLEEEYEEEKALRREAYEQFMQLEKRQLISDEALFSELKRYYGIYFKGGMGAEAVRELLRGIDLEKEATELRAIIASEDSQKQKREKAIKRLEIVDAFLKGGNDPANMILDVIPVIPPDLRPMVQLDGGRFAASDLNDLYRRVINRNNRLKRLLDLDAPAIIVNNEKRMLQESVDALFDNGRRGRPVTGRGGRPLKSLAEALKGKQGRFRQNLLGKRVDYSGRSVIVVDPHLKLHQCGLPSAMALELFKPFVMRRLVELGKVENIKGAKRAIDRGMPAVWDVLDEVIQDRLVLLNRAPTLHRLSIQAFEPVLVEGKAIHLHPLVCAPFNADFDGDQMSVHVPLSTQAQTEARVLMLSTNNLRKPASGEVVTVPSQDMVFGTYFLTTAKDGAEGEGRVFADFDDAILAFDNRDDLDIQANIKVRVRPQDANVVEDGRRIFRTFDKWNSPVDYDVTDHAVRVETTVGRVIFNTRCLPADYPFINYKMNKGDIKNLVNDACDRYSTADVEPILDAIKETGFHYATVAGLTVSVWDAVIPSEKQEMLDEAQDKVDEINEYYEDGFLSERERHVEVVNAWTECTNKLGSKMLEGFAEDNPIYMMADSGARGSKTQLRQLAGMRGLMADMSGDTIDLPIKANFREGLLPLEYFISTYGARKGLVDTASHTSDSGYLTRRLVDVAQDVIVREEDCGTDEAVTYPLIKPGETDVDADLIGRCALNDIVDPATGEVLIPRDGYIESKEDLKKLVAHGLKKVQLRALLTCKSKYGVCQKCYGWDLSTRRPVNIGTAVGIIAAQSIGEPGTQLTMRTIHSGGVAGADDITQGLPTVARMFDVVGNVNEKILGREADLAPVSGTLLVTPEQTEYLIRIVDTDDRSRILEEWRIPASARFMPGMEDGVEVRAGDQITRGFVNFRKLRKLTDIESTMHTFVASVKDVYTSQGVDLNDKHIEVIARQMLRRVQVTNPGDSQYLLGQYVDRYVFADTVRNVALAGGTPPEAEPVILGTLKVASSIDSWLSSASFIRTAGVLTDSSIAGDVDHLLDLKSNVIVGKQIPAGTGLSAYRGVELTYHGTKIDGPTSPQAQSLPEWAPDELKGIEEKLPKQLDWVGDDYGYGGVYSKNGRTLSSEDAKLYLFDDLGVSQRWTNKFSEVGIETVGDLIGKTEDDLLRIDGIGAKAIEELRDGLEARGLLYILEPDDDEADSEDLSQLLNMVFSPDADSDIMLGTAAPAKHHYDDELIGGSADARSSDSDVINEDLGSLDDLLSQVVKQENASDDGDENNE
ncbi:DNA-directed RNA polymerase subunit beta' [Olsenella sp. TM06-36]|uniref:DNA-directed RNA polymerase subunit beta' n=1 Tax=Tractidigestivibacter montrealensis TaxID=2972466 RepID=A0ABT1Z6D7_9ACTN|nr:MULTISPECIES: DNA-directed RNA polymerase subunit beta' [unclassified Olsenella]MCR9035765.1 DNA-directed RNA polymerase subunit beta' [Tractidigestivibacter montrealensis]RGJ46002.1 DNA-directed RNA polymerase subunit beta' [Olsenella sp. TM06-36]RHK04379.1 DNA-directed RNA polymerase subunit beta' [Olsenella sp. AM04-33]